MHSGGRPAATPRATTAARVRLHSCQTVTPETDHSTHYFFQQARRDERGRPLDRRGAYRVLCRAFEEDSGMITAQAREIARDPSAPMLPLAMDAAVVRFRKLVADMVAAEAAAAAAMPRQQPGVARVSA